MRLYATAQDLECELLDSGLRIPSLTCQLSRLQSQDPAKHDMMSMARHRLQEKNVHSSATAVAVASRKAIRQHTSCKQLRACGNKAAQ